MPFARIATKEAEVAAVRVLMVIQFEVWCAYLQTEIGVRRRKVRPEFVFSVVDRCPELQPKRPPREGLLIPLIRFIRTSPYLDPRRNRVFIGVGVDDFITDADLAAFAENKVTRTRPRLRRRVGVALRTARVARGLTLGELVGPYTAAFISRVEYGNAVPSLASLAVLTERLAIPLSDFFALVERVGTAPSEIRTESLRSFSSEHAGLLMAPRGPSV